MFDIIYQIPKRHLAKQKNSEGKKMFSRIDWTYTEIFDTGLNSINDSLTRAIFKHPKHLKPFSSFVNTSLCDLLCNYCGFRWWWVLGVEPPFWTINVCNPMHYKNAFIRSGNRDILRIFKVCANHENGFHHC